MNCGYLLINKPLGPTSHDIINQLRRIIGEKTIGHSGTLDPLASGLLIVAVGRPATKNISQFVKLDKIYAVTAALGATSDTYDAQGKISAVYSGAPLDQKIIEQALQSFAGKQLQTPPLYSAKKVAGKKLYQLARQGKVVEIKPAAIEIFFIKLLFYQWPVLKFECWVSSGTYVRSLAHDLGQRLGCGAYVTALQRTGIGDFNLSQAVELNKLTSANWQNYFLRL